MKNLNISNIVMSKKKQVRRCAKMLHFKILDRKCFIFFPCYVILVDVLEKFHLMGATEDPCSRFRKWLCIATSDGGFTREIWSLLTHTGSVYKLHLIYVYIILLLFVQSERIFFF